MVEHRETALEATEEPFEDHESSAEENSARAASLVRRLRDDSGGGAEIKRPNIDAGEQTQREGTSTVHGFRDRTLSEYHAARVGEFIKPVDHRLTRVEPHMTPDRLVSGCNPRYGEGMEWQTNCVDCARAIERRWRGDLEQASGLVNKNGEDPGDLASWAGEANLHQSNYDDIETRLRTAGHGASALVAVWGTDRYGDRFAHAFNAVNHAGQIYYIDGQVEAYSGWPPTNSEAMRGTTVDIVQTVGWNDKKESLWRR